MSEEYAKNQLSEEEMKRAKEIAEAHWNWFGKTIQMIYQDAMIHGYSHGIEDEKKKEKRREE